jgi:hypothetical protein
MNKLLVSSLAALVVTVANAQAPGPVPPTPSAIPRPPPPAPGSVEMKATGTPGKASASRLATETVTIMALDVAGRTITLQRKSGEISSYRVGPEVTRLSEFAVGDLIKVEWEQGLELEYQPPGSETVAPASGVTTGRSDRDQAPGAVISAGVQGTVTVTAIDAAKRLVTFQGPGGNAYQVKAGPMIQLEKLKVGDRLLATYVEAVAVKLEKAPPRRQKSP